MKTTHNVLASFAALLTACYVHAADAHPARGISIQDVVTDDPAAYASWITKSNDNSRGRVNAQRSTLKGHWGAARAPRLHWAT